MLYRSHQFFILFTVIVINVCFANGYDVCKEKKLDQCYLHSRELSACLDTVYGSMPSTKPSQIKVCHNNFLTAANTVTKTPDWVAYHLSAWQVGHGRNKNDYFCPDPCIPVGQRAEMSDYSGIFPEYNRGHMTPRKDNQWDDDVYKESFFLSNMIPQNSENNSDVWSDLEDDVDVWAQTEGELYIITGPIHDYQGKKHRELGRGKIWAPAAIFKIIYAPSKREAISFIIPNKSNMSRDLSQYLTSIDNINKVTNLNLFNSLAPKIKSQVQSKIWKTYISQTK